MLGMNTLNQLHCICDTIMYKTILLKFISQFLRMQSTTVLYVLQLLVSTQFILVHSQFRVIFYDVVDAVSFNGSNLTSTDSRCVISSFAEGVIECGAVFNHSKLIDGNTGPVSSISDDLGSFFAFSRQTSAIEYTFNTSTESVAITLHFFNLPRESIGFPSISATTTRNRPIPFTYALNNDLTQDDSTIRNTVLDLQPTMPINFLRVNIEFDSNSNIDWFLVSEVEVTEGLSALVSDKNSTIMFKEDSVLNKSDGPYNFSSIIVMSCTVANSGSFDWTWEHNGVQLSINDRRNTRIADATRTNILTIGSLRYSDAGSYSCIVNHAHNSVEYTQVFNVILNSKVEVQSNSPINPGFNAVIVCEAYGYLSSTLGFMRNNQSVTPLQGKYSLTYKEGGRDSIDADGSSRGSQIVELEIANMELTDYGAYTCVSHDNTAQIILNSRTLIESSTESSTQSFSASILSTPVVEPNSSNGSVRPIVLGVAFGIVAIFLAALLIALIVIIIIHRKRGKNTDSKEKQVPIGTNEQQDEVTYSMIADDIFGLQFKNTIPRESYLDLENKISPTGNNKDIPTIGHSMETLYSEINLGGSDKNIAADYSNFKRSLCYKDSVGYDHIRPLSFVLSATYSDGSMYDVPKTLNINSLPRISPSNIEEVSQIGIGQFGEVLLATTKGLSHKDMGLSNEDDKNVIIDVAVKKMKPNSDKLLQMAFEKEMKFMGQLKHDNVVRLLATSSDKDNPFMVMEYMKNGDLNQFLLGHHISVDDSPLEKGQLSPQNLLSMSIQVASGLSYLASHNYIHRDVATRNCLVGDDNVVKIADFGLSRSLYDSVYYRVKGKAKMPIRWMAVECFYGRFSQSSDVWAYGVTVWEIYTMGREPPYPTYSDVEIIQDALRGEDRQILSKPYICPKEVYNIIRSLCWVADYEERGTFLTIYNHLVDIHHKLYDDY